MTGVVLGLALSGCAVGAADVGDSSPAPRADLALDAEVAAAETTGTPVSPAGAGAARPEARGPHDRAAAGSGEAPGAAAADGGPRGGPRPAPGPGPAEQWSALARLADPPGDHGDGPAYADLSAVSFAEREGVLAVTVRLGGTVPAVLADREVEGVGVDFYRSSADESDYQVFLDGGAEGWRAFLQTPEGFVDFPGTFVVRGRDLEVTVPWEALGGRRAATSSVFVDWSEGTGRLATDGTTRLELRPG